MGDMLSVLLVPVLIGWLVALLLPLAPLISRPLQRSARRSDLVVAIGLGCAPMLEIVAMLWQMYGLERPLNDSPPGMEPALHALLLVTASAFAVRHAQNVAARSGTGPWGWLTLYGWAVGALILSRLVPILFIGV